MQEVVGSSPAPTTTTKEVVMSIEVIFAVVAVVTLVVAGWFFISRTIHLKNCQDILEDKEKALKVARKGCCSTDCGCE